MELENEFYLNYNNVDMMNDLHISYFLPLIYLTFMRRYVVNDFIRLTDKNIMSWHLKLNK